MTALIKLCKCGQRPRLRGSSYCRECRAAYQRRYRSGQTPQYAPPAEEAEPTHPRTESRLQIVQARIESEEAALRAAGFNPDQVSAERAERVLSRAAGHVRPDMQTPLKKVQGGP